MAHQALVLDNLLSHPDYRWNPLTGQSTYRGELEGLFQAIDGMFCRWAERWKATSYQVPPMIPAEALAKLDYCQHFPHLATFPVTLDLDQENLQTFIQENKQGYPIQLARIEALNAILTPAACYHCYLYHQGEHLDDSPRYFTTRGLCFRHEAYYRPLQRQWGFSMREVIAVGSADQVKSFLEAFQTQITAFFRKLNWPVRLETATDPFFNPSKNPKYLMQRLEPVKTEMLYQSPAMAEPLAIGSLNFHRNYFGEAYDLSIKENGNTIAAYSGCVAFGVDRWVFAVLEQYGLNASDWPDWSKHRWDEHGL